MNRLVTGRAAVVCSLLLCLALWRPAAAEGALALGIPGDVARQGVSMGYGTNHATSDEAKSAALDECRADGSKESIALCSVAATFRNQCVALAIDPAAGTPGYGWAIADDEATAKQQALANCQAISPANRKAFCTVGDDFKCDVTAK